LPDAALSTSCEADGNLCTLDHCNGSGSCVLESTVTCPGQTGECEAGEHCNPTTGLCEEVPDAPLSTPCDADGDLCTNDHCDGVGNCVNLDTVSCPGPTGPCDGGEACNPSSGACEALPDAVLSTPCEADANLCTNDHCDGSGSCVLQSMVSCAGPTGECDGGESCNPSTGACDPLPDAALGTPCNDDADLCTNDECDGNGGCLFESDVVCVDHNVCTTDSCNPATGCEYEGDPECVEAPLPARRLLIKNPASVLRNKIVFFAKDPQVAIGASGSSGDPRCSGAGGGGASLEVSSEASGQSLSIPLPCENWRAVGTLASPGYKYSDADLSEGPCKVVLIRAGKRVKARCLGRGPHALAYDLQFGQVQAPVKVRLTTGSSAHYCAELGGTLRRDGSDGKTFLAKGAPAPAGCED
jgi:hypothetical protein